MEFLAGDISRVLFPRVIVTGRDSSTIVIDIWVKHDTCI